VKSPWAERIRVRAHRYVRGRLTAIRLLVAFTSLVALIDMSLSSACAQMKGDSNPVPTPMPFAILPEDDNPPARHCAQAGHVPRMLDDLEYIPLPTPGTYLSFGGEVRQYYEYYDNELWGKLPSGDGYLLQRYLFHLDARVARAVRVFVELNSNFAGARQGGPRPAIDKDRFDINSAFLDLDVARKSSGDPLATLRYGREQLDFGAGRLISAREGPDGQGPSVLLDFDGPRVTVRPGAWQISAYAVKPVLNEPGSFDDFPDPTESLTGIYAASAPPMARTPGVDLYLLNVTRAHAAFARGTASERRYTYGARAFANKPDFDYDVELIGQFGTFGNVPIHAYEAAVNLGTAFGNMRRPRVGVEAGISSGDRGDAGQMTAFSAPSPRGFYFGLASPLGPTNVAGVEPNVTFPIGPTVRVEANDYFFWRQSRFDGLYGPTEMPIRPAAADGAAYIGQQPEIVVHWNPDVHVGLNVAYSRFLTGPYFATTPPRSNVDYVASWIRFRF